MVGIGWEITHDQTASRIRPKVSEVAKYGAYLPSGKLAVAVLVFLAGHSPTFVSSHGSGILACRTTVPAVAKRMAGRAV
jgi:hypothetical protein